MAQSSESIKQMREVSTAMVALLGTLDNDGFACVALGVTMGCMERIIGKGTISSIAEVAKHAVEQENGAVDEVIRMGANAEVHVEISEGI
jgi:hypothetical protein